MSPPPASHFPHLGFPKFSADVTHVYVVWPRVDLAMTNFATTGGPVVRMELLGATILGPFDAPWRYRPRLHSLSGVHGRLFLWSIYT